MSERYTKLFSLPENLYAEGAPVILAAGNLLKDTQTGKILAQLKIKNLDEKTVKAARVLVHAQDTTGRPLDGDTEQEYLDLQVKQGEEFGQKTAIPLPNASTRAFSAEVTQIIFADNSVWEATDTVWELLPKPDRLEAALGDSELVKQYKIRFGGDSKVAPQQHKDLWLCACGAWNKAERCHRCAKMKNALFSLDLNELTAEKNARLTGEKAAKEAAQKQAEATAKKTKKILAIVIPVVVVLVAAVLLTTKIFIPNSRYNKAVALAEAGQYDEAIAAFKAMDGYKDSAEQIKIITTTKQQVAEEAAKAEEEAARLAEEEAKASTYAEAEALLAEGKTYEAALTFYQAKGYSDAWERCFELWRTFTDKGYISAGGLFTVGVYKDGTVATVGSNAVGQHWPSRWTDILSVSAGSAHTAGLLADGTVVAGSYNNDGQCHVSDWENIVTVSAGAHHTVGLHADGTVVAVGLADNGQCNVSGWSNIVAISAGFNYTVGLCADGTVLAIGDNINRQCDVSDWTNVIAISAGGAHAVGLHADGTVVAAGNNSSGQCGIADWTDIIAISCGSDHTVGLRTDGTVVAVGKNSYGQCDVSDWTDIVAISAGSYHTVGLRADGSVVAVGRNDEGQCNVSDWTDIKLPTK